MYDAVHDDNYVKEEDVTAVFDISTLNRNINFYKENLPKHVDVDEYLSSRDNGSLLQYFFLNVRACYSFVCDTCLGSLYIHGNSRVTEHLFIVQI